MRSAHERLKNRPIGVGKLRSVRVAFAPDAARVRVGLLHSHRWPRVTLRVSTRDYVRYRLHQARVFLPKQRLLSYSRMKETLELLLWIRRNMQEIA